jgi:hypothetical protein
MSDVSHDAVNQYRAALSDRRSGGVSELGGDATWIDLKPDYYADARILSEDGAEVFEAMLETHAPYGLIGIKGEPLAREFSDFRTNKWRTLTLALRATGRYAMEQATPTLAACPYHDALEAKIGGTKPPLTAYDTNERGLDTLRDAVTPGAMLNAALFTSLIYRLPALQRLHGDTTDPAIFAHNSVSLLTEPLSHPQQHAAAFVLSLGSILEFNSPGFLNDELASRYTKVVATSKGGRLAWAIPTEEFTTRQTVTVNSRVRGSERYVDQSVLVEYPTGTRLADIAVDEPTIGCPGNKLAIAMWHRVIDIAVAEGMGDYSPC